MNRLSNGNFGGGDGSEMSPFIIEDAEDFVQVFYKNRENSNYHYRQAKNIDLLGVNWIPIGDTSQGPPFMGVFDGDNNVIKNLKVASSSSYIGLFGLCMGATLKSINIIDAEVVSLNGLYASILTSYLDGSCVVSNCTVQGTIIGNFSNSNISGLVVSASENSIIERCSADVKLIGHLCAGAVVFANGHIKDCYVKGTIDGIFADGQQRLQSATFVYSCSSTSVIENCYSVVAMNNANTTTSDMGLFALPSNPSVTPIINFCYTDISRGVTTDEWQAGVFYSGKNHHVRGTDNGLYRLIKGQDNLDYSADYPFPPFYDAQPIAGSRYYEFWEAVSPSNNENARTTEQMKTKANFIDWDFEKVWLISEGKSYPTLRRPPRKITCKRVPLNNYRR